MRDNWCVGHNHKYTVGVKVGICDRKWRYSGRSASEGYNE